MFQKNANDQRVMFSQEQQNDELMKKMKQPVHGQKPLVQVNVVQVMYIHGDNSCKAYRCNVGTHYMDVNCKDI